MKTKKIVSLLLCLGVIAVIAFMALQMSGLAQSGAVEELGRALGALSLVPPLFAVVLAFLTGDVILSLLAGVVAGSAMLAVLNGQGIFYETFHHMVVGIVDTSADMENVHWTRLLKGFLLKAIKEKCVARWNIC